LRSKFSVAGEGHIRGPKEIPQRPRESHDAAEGDSPRRPRTSHDIPGNPTTSQKRFENAFGTDAKKHIGKNSKRDWQWTQKVVKPLNLCTITSSIGLDRISLLDHLSKRLNSAWNPNMIKKAFRRYSEDILKGHEKGLGRGSEGN
jgi:hypothetical protein